ncbi:MAG: hypothetical protein LUE12_06170 [Ruminococcus sp.]|nr:hypothetical protein [Ruminococcus sp.]
MKININNKEIKVKESDYDFAANTAMSILISVKKKWDNLNSHAMFYLLVIVLYRITGNIINNLDESAVKAIIEKWGKE